MTSTVTEERRREIYEDGMRVIARECGDPDLNVDRVAFGALASRRQLQRVFGEAGTTVRKSICDVRMARAATLLREPGRPVGQIARAVGYNQPAQFAKAFRRQYGMAPGAWREQHLDRRGADRPWTRRDGAPVAAEQPVSQVA